LDHDRLVGHALVLLQDDLAALAAVELGDRAVLARVPLDREVLADGERAPLAPIDPAGPRRDAVALLPGHGRIEVELGPGHLALAEVAAEVARDPEARAVELGRADRAVVHAERVVEPAVTRRSLRIPVRRTAAGMLRGLRVEVTLAEHRAAA